MLNNTDCLTKTVSTLKLPFVLIVFIAMLTVACAPKRTLIYESFSDKRFSRVKVPAKFQDSKTAELLKSGHLLIGYMDLKKKIRECYSSTGCKQLSDRIPSRDELQKEAARKGGHVISLLDERRVLKPIKKSYCLSQSSYVYWVNNKMYTSYRCNQYGTRQGYLELELSRALIWRYEPQKANASSNYRAIKKAMAYLAKKYKVENKKSLVAASTKSRPSANNGHLFSELKRNKGVNRSRNNYLKLWALRKAIRRGNITQILHIEKTLQQQGLLKAGYRNALMLAIVFKKGEVARALINRKYNIHHKDNKGRTAVIYAIHAGDLKTLKLLLRRGVKINYRDVQGYSLMTHAAIGDNSQIVRYLKRRGLDIDNGNLKGITPLMIAAQNGNLKALSTFIRLGANVNKKTQTNVTPLMFAAMRNQTKVIKYLVSKKARVNDRSKSHNTALVFAAAKGNFETVKTLISAGAKIDIVNKHGGSPLYFALKGGKRAIVNYLIDKGAQLNIGRLSPRSVMLFSIYSNQPKLTEKLIRRGINIKAKALATMLLKVAARYSGAEIFKVLIKNGINVDTKTKSGETALMTAANHGNTKAVKALLRFKANPGLRNKSGLTAMMIATMRGKAKVVTAMRQAGVKD